MEVKEKLVSVGYDVGLLRPWLDTHGRSVVTVSVGNGRLETIPSTIEALLSKEQFMELDRSVLTGFREVTPVISFLKSQKAQLRFDEKKAVQALYSQTLEEVERAANPHVKELVDSTLVNYPIVGIPLPITHQDFKDIDSGADAGKTVGNAVERALISDILNRAEQCDFDQIIQVIDLAYSKKFYGPFLLLAPQDYDTEPVLRDDQKSSITLVNTDLVNDLVLVQYTPDVLRLVVGMDLTAVQWEDHFKVLCIITQQIRADFYKNVGIFKRVK